MPNTTGPEQKLPRLPLGGMPERMRVLFITTARRPASWLSQVFAGDSACDVQVEEALGVSQGVARLRDEVFDTVLLWHQPKRQHALEVIEGLRAGGFDQSLVVLGEVPEEQFSALCYEAGADAYLCVGACTTRTLLWVVSRAIERQRLVQENRRMEQASRARLRQEKFQAERLLDHQRAVVRDLQTLRCADEHPRPGQREFDPATDLPAELVEHYRELLRAYVIMGSGNLGTEMRRLTELLASFGLSARQTMQLHLHVIEDLIGGLGSRSTRHVMSRADLLIMEVMVHLAETYRDRSLAVAGPPRQQVLPGFEHLVDAA